MNVIIIDDTEEIVFWLSTALPLEDDRLKVRGFSAAADLSDDDILWANVALVDWMMPVVGGGDVAERIERVNPDCHIVILTAAASVVDAARWAVLSKPVATADLVEYFNNDG